LSKSYDVLCLEDLGILSSSRESLFQFFQKYYQEVFDPRQRIVLYSKEKLTFALIEHIQKIADLIDIPNNFILLVSPGDIKYELELARQSLSTNDVCINHIDLCIDDATEIASEDKYKISNTMCVLPWLNIAVETNGSITRCCSYNFKIPTNNDSTQSYNINSHSIEDYYHSDHIKQLRQSLLKGEKPESCQFCWKTESYNAKSTREHALGFYIKNFYSKNSDDTVENIINLDLDFGNLCNLKCRICNWRRSSLIASELISKGSKFVDISKEKIKSFNQQGKWFQHPQVLHKFEKILPNLQNIESEGGEPFLYAHHNDWYQKLIDLGCAHNVRFRHSSNGTIFPDHRLWPEFKEIQLCLSIDDIGNRFEYQRDGADWNQVQGVLDQYHALDYDNLKIAFWIVVSLMNVYYLPEIVKELLKYGWELQFSTLDTPRQLSLPQMTNQAKTAILEKYNQYQTSGPEIFEQIKFLIEPIKQSIPTDGSEFWDYITHYDEKRNKYFHSHHPEMAKLMDRPS
jgi:organic radical activating enzyme